MKVTDVKTFVADAYYIPFAPHNPSEPFANAAWYLGSDLSKNVTGAEITVDGGMSSQLYPQVLNDLKRRAMEGEI